MRLGQSAGYRAKTLSKIMISGADKADMKERPCSAGTYRSKKPGGSGANKEQGRRSRCSGRPVSRHGACCRPCRCRAARSCPRGWRVALGRLRHRAVHRGRTAAGIPGDRRQLSAWRHRTAHRPGRQLGDLYRRRRDRLPNTFRGGRSRARPCTSTARSATAGCGAFRHCLPDAPRLHRRERWRPSRSSGRPSRKTIPSSQPRRSIGRLSGTGTARWPTTGCRTPSFSPFCGRWCCRCTTRTWASTPVISGASGRAAPAL